MALLYPLGLLALVALIVPVIIHLWSVRQGKVFKIGSVALLGENAASSAKSIKITDILLFILRCLILMLIAFLLTQPYLEKKMTSRKNMGWILVDKAKITAAYQANRDTIDSLLSLGFELRDFNIGFNIFTLKDTSATSPVTTTSLSYTSLLNQLNTQMPAGYTAYVFAERHLHPFDGNLPAANFKVVWKDLQLSDTLKAWKTDFLAKIYDAESTPSFTRYYSNSTQALPVINAVIYETRGNDSRYIKAAIKAIADFTNRNVQISNWDGSTSSKADVIFWLSEQPFSMSDLKKGATVFTYRKGKTIAVHSTLRIGSSENQPINLKKRIAADGLKGSVVWTDGFGDPILIKNNSKTINHFYFYSRFNPQWNDLVWNEQFVKALIPFILVQPNNLDFGFEDHDADQRLLDKRQPIVANSKISNATTVTLKQDLTNWIWGLAFIFLIIERILSLRNKTNLSYVKSRG